MYFTKRQAVGGVMVLMFLSVGALTAVSFFEYRTKQNIVRSLEKHISESRERMTALAEYTGRNQGDKVVNDFLQDCSYREEYENHLANLSPSSPREVLERLRLLGEMCGNFFAMRKEFMVLRMTEERERLETYISLWDGYTGEGERYREPLSSWGRLVEYEHERGGLLKEQALLQKQIIEGLYNKTPIDTYIARAQEIAARAQILVGEIQNIRDEERREWESISFAPR